MHKRAVHSSVTGRGADGSSVVGIFGSAVVRAVESAGFWGAVLLPFVAVVFLLVKPAG